ncbi:MAG TPA: capsular biosynthesis protein [Flavobacteriales bacterium]|nr:capsular biosynthesis protein [Flavobacteriales bacterium]|tara:strand:+ start:27717 stop:28928 length:1212 start_codon:yes stop_codon:yes gene_type:complete
MIPFSPPRIDNLTIEAVTNVLKSGWITTGPATKKFEKNIAEYIQVPRVICLNSWTNAAELFLRWYGVSEGDEVLVPAYTYAASANIIFHLGATPVLVDSEKGKFNLDLEDLEQKITSKTKVIMPVDIGGFPCDYEAIKEIILRKSPLFIPKNDNEAKLNRILLFSDAAHSLGATINGRPAAVYSDVSCFSFHAVKNLTTAEGGALGFNLPENFDSDQLYKDLNIYSLHGQTKDALSKTTSGSWKYDIIHAGYKCNMTDLQGAIGQVELDRYESETLVKRKSICNSYHQGFKGESWYIAPPMITKTKETSYHLFQLRIDGFTDTQRDLVINELRDKEISTNVHFMPLPFFTFYKEKGYQIADYPNAVNSYSTEISLPVFYDLTNEQVSYIVQTVKQVIKDITNA